MNNESNDLEQAEDLDWENRVLCSDESCIGVIGPNGRCKECGQAYEGEFPDVEASATEPPAQEETDEVAAPEAPLSETDSSGLADDDEWASRTLCSDESCIGVVGPDNRCKECGKPYAG